MKLMQLLLLIKEILSLIKDLDGDGVPDLFDKEPNNPDVH